MLPETLGQDGQRYENGQRHCDGKGQYAAQAVQGNKAGVDDEGGRTGDGSGQRQPHYKRGKLYAAYRIVRYGGRTQGASDDKEKDRRSEEDEQGRRRPYEFL